MAVQELAKPEQVIWNAPPDEKTHKFLTSRRYPIYCLTITKCGCTFLKNLFYALDHDKLHRRADFIHDHMDELVRADDVPGWMLRRSRYAFTVLRDPAHRFLSMYFDKIYGDGPQNFASLRHEIAAECGLDLSRRLSVDGHRENCARLIRWIAANLRQETDIPINAHWRPQIWRVETVAHLSIGTFTLDGLDWQLPQYLGGMIPDLAEKMALVRARNTTKYPVPRDAVLDEGLLRAINTVYADDRARYEKCRAGWNKRRLRSVPAPAIATGETLNVLSTHRFNLNVITQPKAGCSYVRNVVYALDHGRAHPSPKRIEADRCLRYMEKSAREIKDGISIIVLRDPARRFFSFYFDKVWGDGDTAFPWVARKLMIHRKFKTGRDISLDDHRENCHALLRYIRGRMAKLPWEEQNPHWRPQCYRARRAKDFDVRPVLLEEFGPQLTQIADGRLRGLDRALDLVSFRNASQKPVAIADLADTALMDTLRDLYRRDFALYERVSAGWAKTGAPPAL